MTPEEKAAFVKKGKEALTALAYASRTLTEWAESFTQRGGQAELGNDAGLIAALANDLRTSLNATQKALIARLRTDI